MTYISTNDDETNFAWLFDGPVDILLDGKRVFECTEADDERGYISKIARDDRGDLIIENNEIKTVKHFGKVEIVGVRRNAA